MGLMFDKNESESEVIIIQKPYYLYLLLGAVASSFPISFFPEIESLKSISAIFWFCFTLFLLVNIKSIFQTRRLVSSSMRDGQVQVSGSRFSIKNPVIFKIKK